jgi:hypothetical protein
LEEGKLGKVDLHGAIELYRNLVSTDVYDGICRLVICLMKVSKDHEYDEECASLIKRIREMKESEDQSGLKQSLLRSILQLQISREASKFVRAQDVIHEPECILTKNQSLLNKK